MVSQDPSEKLVSTKDGPFRVAQVLNCTVTVVCNGILDLLSIDLVTLAKPAKEARQATEVGRHDDVP